MNFEEDIRSFVPFDLIFLDGLHTAEQTFRDFCNSLAVAGSNTVWVLDDTYPSDVYSLLDSQKEAEKVRREAANSTAAERAWQGDVFKVPLLIHDYFPQFDFATTFAGGKGQTVIWRSNRRGFKSKFNYLSEISNLGYLDFIKHKNCLNMRGSFEDLERYIYSSIGKA